MKFIVLDENDTIIPLTSVEQFYLYQAESEKVVEKQGLFKETVKEIKEVWCIRISPIYRWDYTIKKGSYQECEKIYNDFLKFCETDEKLFHIK